ncbi:hypothetical protein D1872_265930 [compost metagenome]
MYRDIQEAANLLFNLRLHTFRRKLPQTHTNQSSARLEQHMRKLRQQLPHNILSTESKQLSLRLLHNALRLPSWPAYKSNLYRKMGRQAQEGELLQHLWFFHAPL